MKIANCTIFLFLFDHSICYIKLNKKLSKSTDNIVISLIVTVRLHFDNQTVTKSYLPYHNTCNCLTKKCWLKIKDKIIMTFIDVCNIFMK